MRNQAAVFLYNLQFGSAASAVGASSPFSKPSCFEQIAADPDHGCCLIATRIGIDDQRPCLLHSGPVSQQPITGAMFTAHEMLRKAGTPSASSTL